MIDPRIYRAGLAPLLLALVVTAFSIQSPPRALNAGLPPDSFDGGRAFAELNALARAYPLREPGGRGDTALAARVRSQLRLNGFDVRTERFGARTVRGRQELQTVIGERTGRSSRRIVILAHRDALARPATAELTGTAALLELARVFQGRTLRKTLLLVSTSGGSGGAAGAARLATQRLGGRVDAVLVLGDLGGPSLQRRLVVPWSNRDDVAPFWLRATVGSAVRQETGLRPAEAGIGAQFARLAVPITVGEQGVLVSAGLPAVLMSASGERGPGDASRVDQARLTGFGRAALRAVTAFDARVAAPGSPRAELYWQGKLLPGWAVRLLIAALVFPAVISAVDGFARVRRRQHRVGPWVGWVLGAGLPYAAALAFAWLLSLVGLIPRPPAAPAPVGAIPLGAGGVVALVCVGLAALVAFLALRPAAQRLTGRHGDPGNSPGAAAALAVVLAGITTCAWVFNPFAAALLLPVLHGWLLLSAPELRVRRAMAIGVVGLTLLPVALVGLYYALVLGAGPGQLLWYGLLFAVGGDAGVLGPLSWCVLLGCLGCLLAILRSRRFELEASSEPTIRGPLSYAGPGSLGGTESALRR